MKDINDLTSLHRRQKNIFMSDNILTLAKAKLFVDFPEMYIIFSKDWLIIADVEYDALRYLVEHSSRILLLHL